MPLDISIDRIGALGHFVHAIVATTVVNIASRVSLRHGLLILLREHDVLLTDLHSFGWTIAGSVSVRDALILILGFNDVAARSLNSLSFRRRSER